MKDSTFDKNPRVRKPSLPKMNLFKLPKRAAKKIWEGDPFHVEVHHLVMGKKKITTGFTILLFNKPFLTSNRKDKSRRITRPEAYAICALLNRERRGLKWAAKFGDPYV